MDRRIDSCNISDAIGERSADNFLKWLRCNGDYNYGNSWNNPYPVKRNNVKIARDYSSGHVLFSCFKSQSKTRHDQLNQIITFVYKRIYDNNSFKF